MHFVLNDGCTAAVLITPIEYARAWKMAQDTTLEILVQVVNPDGVLKKLDIREFEKKRLNGFAQQRKGL